MERLIIVRSRGPAIVIQGLALVDLRRHDQIVIQRGEIRAVDLGVEHRLLIQREVFLRRRRDVTVMYFDWRSTCWSSNGRAIIGGAGRIRPGFAVAGEVKAVALADRSNRPVPVCKERAVTDGPAG